MITSEVTGHDEHEPVRVLQAPAAKAPRSALLRSLSRGDPRGNLLERGRAYRPRRRRPRPSVRAARGSGRAGKMLPGEAARFTRSTRRSAQGRSPGKPPGVTAPPRSLPHPLRRLRDELVDHVLQVAGAVERGDLPLGAGTALEAMEG